MRALVARWVAFWDEKEPPTTLVAVRVLLAVVMLYDLILVGVHGVPTWLWAPTRAASSTRTFSPR